MNSDISILVYGGLIMFSILSVALVLFVVAYNRSQKFHEAEKETLQAQISAELSKSQLEISEKGMRMLGKEIHDNIGQRMTLLYRGIQKLESDNTELSGLAKQVIEELKDISKSLHTSYLKEMGIDLALERECKLVQKYSGIKCQYNHNSTDFKLSEAEEVLILRCVQEVLNNGIKHANASKMEISAQQTNNELTISYQDNGQGFDSTQSYTGIGLKSLEERLSLMNGSLNIESSKGNGTFIELKVPITLTINERQN